jgi:AcrR family transcriptional regulator
VKGLRRTPRQERSRARVQAVFAAADRILGTEGPDALTMRRLSDEAGVPIGTVYQFFEDKQSVVKAVSRHYADVFTATMESLVERAGDDHWADLMGVVIDEFTALYRRYPGYVAIWSRGHMSPKLLHPDNAEDDVLATGLRRILLAQEDLADGPALTTACQVAIQTGGTLLQLAFRISPSGDPATIDEAKRITRLYVADAVGRLGR